MTRDQIAQCAAGLAPRDFPGFAAEVAAIDPVLGEVVRLHVEAADGNSPSLEWWVEDTAAEAQELAAAGIDTREAARAWWWAKYEYDE